mgnify:CR=1 FL=1
MPCPYPARLWIPHTVLVDTNAVGGSWHGCGYRLQRIHSTAGAGQSLARLRLTPVVHTGPPKGCVFDC